jgi:DNA-binding MarR family transcriptional regulator
VVRHDGDDLTCWLEYTAEGLAVVLDRVWQRVQRLSAESRHAKLILRPRQERLLNLLREHKSMTPREIWAALGVSKQGALDILRPLVEAGLVKRTGTRKSGRYVLAQEKP